MFFRFSLRREGDWGRGGEGRGGGVGTRERKNIFYGEYGSSQEVSGTFHFFLNV